VHSSYRMHPAAQMSTLRWSQVLDLSGALYVHVNCTHHNRQFHMHFRQTHGLVPLRSGKDSNTFMSKSFQVIQVQDRKNSSKAMPGARWCSGCRPSNQAGTCLLNLFKPAARSIDGSVPWAQHGTSMLVA
jgi:hypothetical protein